MAVAVIDAIHDEHGAECKNHSERTHVIDTIVLHSTAGSTAEGAVAWFHNPECKTSAHYVIGRDGKCYKVVPCSKRAWHASSTKWNDRSIGIELTQLSLKQKKPQQQLTKAQLATLDSLIKLLKTAYPITHLVGHKEVAEKSDPYTLDMAVLRGKYGLKGVV